jgi:hypothetical protein
MTEERTRVFDSPEMSQKVMDDALSNISGDRGAAVRRVIDRLNNGVQIDIPSAKKIKVAKITGRGIGGICDAADNVVRIPSGDKK